MILRLRQVCCHPHLILVRARISFTDDLILIPLLPLPCQSLADGFEDPSMLVGSESDKELSRAKKVMGAAWAIAVRLLFVVRTRTISSTDTYSQSFKFRFRKGQSLVRKSSP